MVAVHKLTVIQRKALQPITSALVSLLHPALLF